MGVNRLNSVQKATNLKEKSKVGINEMFSIVQKSIGMNMVKNPQNISSV